MHLRMPCNREMMASISFEPGTASGRGSPKQRSNSNSAKERESFDAMVDVTSQQNEATREFISCLKWALAQSTAGSLNPAEKQFSGSGDMFSRNGRIDVEVPRKDASGIDCCGGVGRVKRGQTQAISVRKTGFYSPSPSKSSRESDGGMEDPPVSLTFFDYAPECYSRIRGLFRIDPMTYSNALLHSRWHSTPTPGKSAAQLFFCGKDWVIKTMTNEESGFLRSILKKYFTYVSDNPYTLLPHFLGHHCLEISGKRTNVIIMQNVFATTNTIHEKYDVKGSTEGRFATEAEKMKQTCTQKDLDLNHPIHVGSPRREILIEQIKKDCDFLKGCHIMDYSFLVGIHVLAPYNFCNVGAALLDAQDAQDGTPNQAFNACSAPITEQAIDGRCFTADNGGMLSVNQPGARREIYYVGIIDILQKYNARKHLETFFRGVMRNSRKISSVPPDEYMTRFLSFISSIIT